MKKSLFKKAILHTWDGDVIGYSPVINLKRMRKERKKRRRNLLINSSPIDKID